MDSDKPKEFKIKSEPTEAFAENDEEEYYLITNIKEEISDSDNDVPSQYDINASTEYVNKVPEDSYIEQEHYDYEDTISHEELNIKAEPLEQNSEPVDFGKNWLSYEVKDEIMDDSDEEFSQDAMIMNLDRSKGRSQISNNVQDWSSNNTLSHPRLSTSAYSNKDALEDMSIDQQNSDSSLNESEKKLIRDQSKKMSFPCRICGRIFALASNLKRHFRIHPDLSLDNTLKITSGLTNSETPARSENIFSTSFCIQDKSTSSSDKDISTHQQNYDSSWKESSKMNNVNARTTKKTYPCKICGHISTKSSNFKRHMRTHSGEKPYECDVCKNLFARKETFVRHKRIHSGEKPFRCDVCSREFSDSSCFIRHKRVHSKEKPFKCDVCNLTFSRSSSKKRHQNRIHNL